MASGPTGEVLLDGELAHLQFPSTPVPLINSLREQRQKAELHLQFEAITAPKQSLPAIFTQVQGKKEALTSAIKRKMCIWQMAGADVTESHVF